MASSDGVQAQEQVAFTEDGQHDAVTLRDEEGEPDSAATTPDRGSNERREQPPPPPLPPPPPQQQQQQQQQQQGEGSKEEMPRQEEEEQKEEPSELRQPKGVDLDDSHRHTHSIESNASSVGYIGTEQIHPMMNLVELDALMAEAPKELVSCSSIEVMSEGGTLNGSADLCLHPVEHADALLSAQEAKGPRHGIRVFKDASQGGRRHVLMLPVNALVKGLNQVSMNDPLLDGWMGISPAELARYMLWSGYDTLLLQQVPVMQATSGLGRWRLLEFFTEAFARAWEEEAKILLGDSQRSRQQTKGIERDPATPGSRESRTGATGAAGGFHFAHQSMGVQRVQPSSKFLPIPLRTHDSEEVSEKPYPVKKEMTVVNPMMGVFSSLGGNAAVGGDMESVTRGRAGFWPAYIRVHTASVLVENGDAFVHHAFMSRDVDHPWWYSVKGIVMRNRHLDVKGLYSHSYASEVYKSRTQVVTFLENYVEDDGADELEEMIKTKKSLWEIAKGTSQNVGRGRRLSMFAVEEVDASVNIDPIDPPAAFRRVVVGEEFSEADALLPRPFSSVDIGHFLTVMQTKSIPALVCFSLPPSLSDLKVFQDKQEPISMVQYLSHSVFAGFEPNMPRVATASGGGGGEDVQQKSIVRSASAISLTAGRGKGVRWADQQVSKQEDTGLDPLACPNLEAFLDEVTSERKRTGAVEWSTEGEEEADWIEAVVEQLRRAKKSASKIVKTRAAMAVAAAAVGGDEDQPDGLGEVPEWVVQQLPDLLRLLEACRLLAHDSTLLQTMVDASHRVAKRRKGDNTPGGATPSRSQTNTPSRSRTNTPNRSRPNTPNSGAKGVMRTPGGREIEEDEEEDLLRTYEEEALPLHWTDVEKLGKSDSLQNPENGPELLEDQLLSAYLEYSVGQPRLGTRSSARAQEMVLNNVQFLIDSGSLTPIHYETSRCGPVKSDLFKAILARFSAMAIMLQSSRKGSKDTSPETKDYKDIKAAVHALLSWVSVSQVYACMSAIALAGGADPPTAAERSTPTPLAIEVYVVEKQVLTFTGASESEEHYAFHSLYRETAAGLTIYVTKEHQNMAAGVFWCYLKAMGVPVMICHLAESLMDRTIDCRWDVASGDEMFKSSALKEGAMRLGYIGDLRPLNFLSETCQYDIQEAMPILERACLLRMLAHGHGCLAEYSAAGPSKAKSRSELAASFRIVSTWRLALVQNLRSMDSSRYLNKFEEHLRQPRLTIVGAVIGHRGVDPRRVLWWTWIAVPWSPSARAAITNLLTVISRAPPPRVSSASAAEHTPLSRSTRRKSARVSEMVAGGGAALAGPQQHGALWKMISDLLVTRLGTCMLVRSLVLENRDESPYPPNEKHYHMVALELRGADKTAVFEYLRTDPGMLGEVLNRLIREDCLAADHSAAFLDSKSLGTLHNVKHGKSGNTPIWLETGLAGRLKRIRDVFTGPKDSPVVHGYSVGMYYSMPVLIELLLQLTSDGKSSIYTNSALGTSYESVVPMALLHSLVVFGGLSLGAAKISSVNFFSFMVIKLVLAQIQFVAVLIVASVVLLPFVSGAALLLWWDNPFLAITFIGVFFFVGIYIMLVSLMLSTTGGKPWSSNSGRTLLLAHAFLLISPTLTRVGVIPEEHGSKTFMGGVGLLLLTLAIGFTVNTRRLYNMTLSKQTLTLTDEEWKEWHDDHKNHADPTSLFYKRCSSMFTAWRHRLTRKRRYRMLDGDLEQFLLGFDAIRSAQAVPARWSKSWDDRLKRGHEALVAVNRGAGVETASTMWAVVKWDVIYGAAYFLMVFSDNMVSIWTDKKIVESDDISTLALALFIVATAGLESMMMVNLGRSNGWRFWRMDPEVLSMSDASKSVSNALHKLYLWDFASYSCFVLMCTLAVCCLGYFWLIPDLDWELRPLLRAVSLVVGYLGILVGLFHKILFGGSVSRQKASVKVSAAALAVGYGCGLGLEAANRYLEFSSDPLAFATLGFTGFFYAFFSMYIYGEFRVQLTSQGFASGQLLSTPSLGTAGQRCLGVATLHLDGMEARATESCRASSGGRILTQIENRELIRRTLFSNNADPSSLWTRAPRTLRAAFGNKVPRNDDFFRWTISPVPDRCLLEHGLNALVDPEQDDLLYVAETIYADRQAFMECLMHETYEWAYGSHQVGVLAELLRDPLPSRMRRQIVGEGCRLPTLVDRTLPCSVDIISIGCLKNEMYWRDLSPHARELVLRMVLTQSPSNFRHVEDNNQGAWQMSFVIDDEVALTNRGSGSASPRGEPMDPHSDLALAMRLGCRTGNVLVAAMEEASLGLEPQVVVARASLLSGLSQCVMRYALAHILANPTESAAKGKNRRSVSVGHLQGRQRVWGAMANAPMLREAGNTKKYGRQSNVEALLGEVETVFPSRGSFHLDYMLFGAASGCMGFDREAFALMLDQNPWSLPMFIKMHRASHWLYKKLLNQMVLKTDPLISDLMKTIDAADADTIGGFGAQGDGANGEEGSDPEDGVNWLVEQRKSLEGMIRDQDLPIAFSQWLDQRLLRREPLLADYWEARDSGNFSEALVSLKLVEVELTEGLKTGIPAGLSTHADLATFAKCGSTVGMMRAARDGEGGRNDSRPGGGTYPGNIKSDGGVCVVAMDSGTWPLYGGGVAVCRKQLLDDTVGRVRWNTLFEVALPAPLPRNVDTPENIRQVLPIPLWSQNAGGAYETFLAHTSFITRSLRESRTTNAAINTFFVPQLKTLIDLANTPGESVSVGGLEIGAAAVAEIYAYFQVFDWETTWKAGTTHDHWAASWLACAARDKQAGPLLNSEKPNLAELHEILNYWQTLLTCLQVQLPEMNAENRGVIHVSHHGTQALVGIAAKRLSGWALVVWDHGMLWRERCKAIAELHSSSLFVRKSLISLHRLVAKITLYEADTLTPCTQMNKPWEMRCVSERDSEVRDLVSRKVNPVLNGAPASITPNEFLEGFNADNKNEWVTVVMLSHVYALKGVLTAIQAADLIVHRYGMKKFRLMIYGSTTHDVVYCRRCQDAIERLKLTDNVWLKGKGRPAAVLAQGDAFLNSSVSEGLPLAIIEASRAGLVVIATDVGGTRDVVGEFGGVCRPNSPLELAKTQLETLAACKKWCKIGGAPNLDWGEIDLTPNPCEMLEKAIFNKDVINARHNWGTRYLEWTSKAFTLDRYRDEHVRALWFADRQAMTNCARLSLDWGPDPGHKRLVVAYLRLRRLLDVSDRKEHTNLSFISNFGEVRARIRTEQKSRSPIAIPVDGGQLAQMGSFQTVTSDLPLLQWLHGGKSEWNDYPSSGGESSTGEGGGGSEFADNASMTSGMSLGVLQRIEEGDMEQQSADSGSRLNSQTSSRTPRGLHGRTDSGSTQATDYDNSGSGRSRERGLDGIPDDDALGNRRVVVTSSRGGGAVAPDGSGSHRRDDSGSSGSHRRDESGSDTGSVVIVSRGGGGRGGGGGGGAGRGLTLGERMAAGSSPGVSRSSARGSVTRMESGDSHPWDAEEDDGTMSCAASSFAAATHVPAGRASSPGTAMDSVVSHVNGDGAGGGGGGGGGGEQGVETDAQLQRKLEKLELFEELDRRLMERVGVHLQDVGDLSSPALAKILRDTDNSPGPFQQYLPAPSPAASASATPSPAANAARASDGNPNTSGSFSGASDGSSLVGVRINLANVESPVKSLTSILSGGPLEGVSVPNISGGGGGSSGSQNYTSNDAEEFDEHEAEARGSGRSRARGGGGGAEGGTGGKPTSRTEPVDLQAYFSGAGRELTDDGGGGDSPAASPNASFAGDRRRRNGSSSGSRGGGDGGGSRGRHHPRSLPDSNRDNGNDNEASVELSEGRGWAPSPINAVQKEDGVPPWESLAGGDGGREDVAGPGGNYRVYNSADPGDFRADGGGSSASSWRKRQDDPSFDESAFRDHEKRMRHAFIQRMGSVDSASTVGPGAGLGGTGDGESLSSLSKRGSGEHSKSPSAVNRRHSQRNASDSRKSYASNLRHSTSGSISGGITGISSASLVTSSAHGVAPPPASSPTRRSTSKAGRSSGDRPSGHRSRPANVQHVMHPREDEPPKPVASVSVEVWKKRARKRQHLIKAMATSQQLAAALAPGAGAGAGGGGSIGGGSVSSMGSDRSSVLGWAASNGGQSTPPEMERPLPYVKDVLAKQGVAERGIKKFENPGQPGHQRVPEGKPASRRRVEQAAANFAAEDSADDTDEDEVGSIVSGGSYLH